MLELRILKQKQKFAEDRMMFLAAVSTVLTTILLQWQVMIKSEILKDSRRSMNLA